MSGGLVRSFCAVSHRSARRAHSCMSELGYTLLVRACGRWKGWRELAGTGRVKAVRGTPAESCTFFGSGDGGCGDGGAAYEPELRGGGVHPSISVTTSLPRCHTL